MESCNLVQDGGVAPAIRIRQTPSFLSAGWPAASGPVCNLGLSERPVCISTAHLADNCPGPCPSHVPLSWAYEAKQKSKTSGWRWAFGTHKFARERTRVSLVGPKCLPGMSKSCGGVYVCEWALLFSSCRLPAVLPSAAAFSIITQSDHLDLCFLPPSLHLPFSVSVKSLAVFRYFVFLPNVPSVFGMKHLAKQV